MKVRRLSVNETPGCAATPLTANTVLDPRHHVRYYRRLCACSLGFDSPGPCASRIGPELQLIQVRRSPLRLEFGVLIYELICSGFMHLACGLSVGLTGLAAGYCIGIVGDKGVRAYMLQSRIFVGMVLILIFGEVLGLYG